MEINYDIFGSVTDNNKELFIEKMSDIDDFGLDDLESEIGLIEDDIEEEVVSSETEVIDPEFQDDIGFSEVDTPVPAGDDVETFESLHLHNENLIFSADGSGDSIPKNENIEGNEIQENFASRPICWTRMPKGCRRRLSELPRVNHNDYKNKDTGWFRDTGGDRSKDTCLKSRKRAFDGYCGTPSEKAYQPNKPDISSEGKNILLLNTKRQGLSPQKFNELLSKQKLPFYIQWEDPSSHNKVHRKIVYKRLTPIGKVNMYDLFTHNWFSSKRGVKNDMNRDFRLFNNFDDAKANRNPWKFCNYDDPRVGFPRDCGPNGPAGGSWISTSRRRGFGFSNWSFTLLNATGGESSDGHSVNVGSNMTNSKGNVKNTKDMKLVTKIMNLNEFEIEAKIKIDAFHNNWRNILHRGNNDGEREPSLWIFPHTGGNQFRFHFRINHSSRKNDGLDFNFPAKHRRTGEHTILIKLKQDKAAKKIRIDGFVNGDHAGHIDIGNAILIVRDRPIWIKGPWHTNGAENKYFVRSLIFRSPGAGDKSGCNALMPTSGLRNKYTYESYKGGNTWNDLISGKHGSTTRAEIVKPENHTKYRLDSLKQDFGYIKIPYNGQLSLPEKFSSSSFTLVAVTRYDPKARRRKRILDFKGSNSLVGHWNTRAGISHLNGWQGHHDRDKISAQDSWIFSISQPKRYIRRSAKDGWKDSRGGGTIHNNNTLHINSGQHRNEASDANVAEIIIYNKTLNESEINQVKKYLEAKYITNKCTDDDSEAEAKKKAAQEAEAKKRAAEEAKKKEEARKKAEAARKAIEEAKRAAAEAKRRRDAEAKRIAAAKAAAARAAVEAAKRAAAARRRAAEAKKRAIAAAFKRAAEARRKREAAIRAAAERKKREDAKRAAEARAAAARAAAARAAAARAAAARAAAARAEAERKRKAEEERRRAIAEAKRKAEELARKKAIEAKRKAEEEKRKAVAEAKRLAEIARIKAAEEEAKRKAAEALAARKAAAAKAEAAAKAAEEEALRVAAEEEARKKAAEAEELRKKLEEEKKKQEEAKKQELLRLQQELEQKEKEEKEQQEKEEEEAKKQQQMIMILIAVIVLILIGVGSYFAVAR